MTVTSLNLANFAKYLRLLEPPVPPRPRVGFTGTSMGLAPRQVTALTGLLGVLNPAELHEGDCVGGDYMATTIARTIAGCVIHSRPCTIRKARAFGYADVSYPPKDPLVRNHDIVDATQILVACPRRDREELRSGTWATVRYARKLGRPIVMVWPNGDVTDDPR